MVLTLPFTCTHEYGIAFGTGYPKGCNQPVLAVEIVVYHSLARRRAVPSGSNRGRAGSRCFLVALLPQPARKKRAALACAQRSAADYAAAIFITYWHGLRHVRLR